MDVYMDSSQPHKLQISVTKNSCNLPRYSYSINKIYYYMLGHISMCVVRYNVRRKI